MKIVGKNHIPLASAPKTTYKSNFVNFLKMVKKVIFMKDVSRAQQGCFHKFLDDSQMNRKFRRTAFIIVTL